MKHKERQGVIISLMKVPSSSWLNDVRKCNAIGVDVDVDVDVDVVVHVDSDVDGMCLWMWMSAAAMGLQARHLPIDGLIDGMAASHISNQHVNAQTLPDRPTDTQTDILSGRDREREGDWQTERQTVGRTQAI